MKDPADDLDREFGRIDADMDMIEDGIDPEDFKALDETDKKLLEGYGAVESAVCDGLLIVPPISYVDMILRWISGNYGENIDPEEAKSRFINRALGRIAMALFHP